MRDKYKELTEQVMSKVQEIFDSAKYSQKIEIHIDMEIASVPQISYKIEKFQVIPSEADGL